jgi:hypothetical protein
MPRVQAAACVALVLGAFVFAHTGSRAAALCAREGSAVPGSISLWPPGVKCSGGLPVVVRTELDLAALILAVPAAALLVFGGSAVLMSARRRSAP